ncbi:MAG: LamG domain-containing protein, partial [Planctomycetes bacterium]|nr:LamG domain-containing protein [Planctomycetota bacterium]
LGLADSASADLLVHWDLDEGSGAVATDASGNGRDGTFTGEPQWVTGVNGGGALHFDGDDDFVSHVLPGDQAYATFTIAVWAKADDVAQADLAGVFASHFPGGATGAGFQIDLASTLVYQIRPNTGSAVFGDATLDWVHLAVVAEGTSVQLYYQGAPTGNATLASNLINEFTVGVNRARSRFFAGTIDDLRVYDHGLSEAEIRAAMKGDTTSSSAPRPEDGMSDVSPTAPLEWNPGEFAETHDVYFGTQLDDVNDASRASPLNVLVSQGQSDTSFDPAGVLEFGQTYFWRVDEVNSAPDFTVFKGGIWSFTAEPLSIPITQLTVTASSSFGASVPENTINGSGLTGDLHGTISSDMWISTGIPATIEYAFDRAYKLHELWVWNSNQTIESFIGFGAKDVVIEHSLDGENWTVLEGVGPLAQAPGTAGYAHNNTVGFGGVTAQHVRMTINSVQGFAPQASLSEVRFFSIPTLATRPSPDSGATNVAPDLLLSWGRDGREAGRHDVYIGTDANDLSLAGSVTESNFDTQASDLQLGQTYYWQVVEVNEAETPTEWAGDVWSFTTVGSIVIDDMESYRDEEFLEIWATWIDGFDDPANNGAIVGAVPSLGDFSPETDRVHGGSQSLPLHYDNRTAAQSEATRTFDTPMDWTEHGVASLVLYFEGSSTNTGGNFYVKINDTKIAYDGDASNLMRLGWNKWTLILAEVGANLSRVSSL